MRGATARAAWSGALGAARARPLGAVGAGRAAAREAAWRSAGAAAWAAARASAVGDIAGDRARALVREIAGDAAATVARGRARERRAELPRETARAGRSRADARASCGARRSRCSTGCCRRCRCRRRSSTTPTALLGVGAPRLASALRPVSHLTRPPPVTHGPHTRSGRSSARMRRGERLRPMHYLARVRARRARAEADRRLAVVRVLLLGARRDPRRGADERGDRAAVGALGSRAWRAC